MYNFCCGAAGAANLNDVGAAGAAPYSYMIVHGVGMGRKDMGGEGAEEAGEEGEKRSEGREEAKEERRRRRRSEG